MSLYDAQNLFSDDQAITVAAVSTNIIDLGAVDGDGAGRVIPIVITEAFNNLTSLEVILQTDDNSSFSSAKEIASSGDVVLANIDAVGDTFQIVMPAKAERYIRLSYVPTGTAPTTGKVHAGFVLNDQTNDND